MWTEGIVDTSAGSQSRNHVHGLYSRHIKRCIDVLIALLCIILLSPCLIFLAILVRAVMGSPVLFRQERIGLRARRFVLYKYRTMKPGIDPEDRHSSGGTTRFGRLLRNSSLDELPQFFNVLEGSMSLIGPRPLLPEYLPLYSPEQVRRHDVLPGITGWAQVNGRNAVAWERRFQLDLWYVDHLSFWLDMKILWLTIGCLFRGDGIDQPGRSGAERFMGQR